MKAVNNPTLDLDFYYAASRVFVIQQRRGWYAERISGAAMHGTAKWRLAEKCWWGAAMRFGLQSQRFAEITAFFRSDAAMGRTAFAAIEIAETWWQQNGLDQAMAMLVAANASAAAAANVSGMGTPSVLNGPLSLAPALQIAPAIIMPLRTVSIGPHEQLGTGAIIAGAVTNEAAAMEHVDQVGAADGAGATPAPALTPAPTPGENSTP